MKIGVIGLGMVGKEILFNLHRGSAFGEIYVIDLNEEKTSAEIMDLEDSVAFGMHSIFNRLIYTQNYSHLQDADVVIINVSIVPLNIDKSDGNSSGDRLDGLQANAELMKKIAKNFSKDTKTKFIITSNPVDLLTQVFIEASGISPRQIIGSGTALDTARLEIYLSQHYGISSENIQGFVIGEHGNSSMIPWSLVKICGVSVEEYSQISGIPMIDKDKALDYVRARGLVIYGARGYTDHGIGAAVHTIIMTLLSNERRVIPVSVMTQGEYGLDGYVLGLPCIIGSNGIEKVLTLPLTPEEEFELSASKKILEEAKKILD